ncbi:MULTISPECIES: NUDIX hydrolase [Cupriavidus]
MKPNKACPVVRRFAGDNLQVLAFEHPLAGLQLVKGTIEPGEPECDAALRELAEESGIVDARVVADLGVWETGYQGQVWSFQLCEPTSVLPDGWTHQTADDGGHDFRFFWHSLSAPRPAAWHWLFRDALGILQHRLRR